MGVLSSYEGSPGYWAGKIAQSKEMHMMIALPPIKHRAKSPEPLNQLGPYRSALHSGPIPTHKPSPSQTRKMINLDSSKLATPQWFCHHSLWALDKLLHLATLKHQFWAA